MVTTHTMVEALTSSVSPTIQYMTSTSAVGRERGRYTAWSTSQEISQALATNLITMRRVLFVTSDHVVLR